MAELLTPEAQAAFDLQRGTQDAINEFDEKRLLFIQKRAAELAQEYADERKREADKAAQINADTEAKAKELHDRIGKSDTFVMDRPTEDAPDRVVDKALRDPSVDDAPPPEKQTNGAPKGSNVKPSDKAKA